MISAFVSESGKVNFRSSVHYAMSVILVEQSNKKRVHEDIVRNFSRIKHRYHIKEGELFVKAGDILRHRYQYAELSLNDRIALFRDIGQILPLLDLKIMGLYLDKEIVWWRNASDMNAVQWIRNWMWRLLLERVTQFTSMRGEDRVEIILPSINTASDIWYNDQINRILHNDDRNNFINKDVEVALSHSYKGESQCLQVADIVSWVIGRYYKVDVDFDEHNIYDQLANDLFREWEDIFARDDEGKIEGFGMKIFPSLLQDNKPQYLSPNAINFWNPLFGYPIEFEYDNDEKMG